MLAGSFGFIQQPIHRLFLEQRIAHSQSPLRKSG
jgi:hypothetical protein